MPYKDQIIHLRGGIEEYIGELDQAEHKMGKDWYRILNPCMVKTVTVNGQMQQRMIAIQGNGDYYKRWVDIRIPEDSIIEILTVDKKGDLFKSYLKEGERHKSSIIHAPDTGNIALQ